MRQDRRQIRRGEKGEEEGEIRTRDADEEKGDMEEGKKGTGEMRKRRVR